MKNPLDLKNEARDEAYEYFDKYIRPLPKTPDGKINPSAGGLEDNDADAFRHAYVSGVFTQVYNKTTAKILGHINELHPLDIYVNSNNPMALNMDLWNNSIGIKYGQKTKSRKKLLKLIHKALEKNELITTPQDERQFKGSYRSNTNNSKPIVVLKEDKKGRNKIFYDTQKRIVMTLDEFITSVQNGIYPNYSLKTIRGHLTPISKRDSHETNNLG